jgi:hypothetical protein
MNRIRLAFGNSTLEVPANGIPILKAKCGCPVIIESMVVVDQGASGYRFQYDQSAEKLIVMQAPAQTHSHDIKAIGGLTSSEPLLLDASQVFGKNAATNRTIVGANSATTGGVVSATLAAAAMAEASAVAIAAQTIEVEVIGW